MIPAATRSSLMEQVQELNWEDYFGSLAAKAAYEELKRLTRKALLLYPRSLVPSIPNPFWSPSRTTIRVFIDQASPTVSHAIVHELIHGLLMEEGYHRLTGEELRRCQFVRNVLSNEFQHPEVFRRMESFGLD